MAIIFKVIASLGAWSILIALCLYILCLITVQFQFNNLNQV
jgi:hypothetical protein